MCGSNDYGCEIMSEYFNDWFNALITEPDNLKVAKKTKEKYPVHNWVCDRVVVFCADCGLIIGHEKIKKELERCPK